MKKSKYGEHSFTGMDRQNQQLSSLRERMCARVKLRKVTQRDKRPGSASITYRSVPLFYMYIQFSGESHRISSHASFLSFYLTNNVLCRYMFCKCKCAYVYLGSPYFNLRFIHSLQFKEKNIFLHLIKKITSNKCLLQLE